MNVEDLIKHLSRITNKKLPVCLWKNKKSYRDVKSVVFANSKKDNSSTGLVVVIVSE